MGKAALFLSRFLLGLWLVLVSAFLFLLLSNTPSNALYLEVRLLSISAGLSLIGGISAAFFAWFHPSLLSKTFASFACGCAVAYALVWGLLGGVPYSIVSSYGFTPDTWDWIVDKAVITAIAGTTLTNSLLFWRRCNRFTRILISISIGVGIFYLCRLSISWNFDYLASFFGFLQDEALIIWLSTVISAIVAIIAVILLWLNTNQSIKIFLCLSNGFGATALTTFFFLHLLLSLGYAD